MSSTFGERFRIMTFGESHGSAIGVVIDGCPPGLALTRTDVQTFLDRRKPGQSPLTTPRSEPDEGEILSGVSNGITLGSPIALVVRNQDKRSGDYADLQNVFRPSHADYTTLAKYGVREASGGARSSARETIGRVAAAAVARQVCRNLAPGIEVVAWVHRVHDIQMMVPVDIETISQADVDLNPVRCPDAQAARLMEARILDMKSAGDTVGGAIAFVARGVPAGLGEPVFDKLEASLAAGLMSLPASKSFEIGSGLHGTFLRGSEHNDAFVPDTAGRVRTATNRSGGVQGGISNGMPITGTVGFKPVSTIFTEQDSVNTAGEAVRFAPARGRHDPCVLPRAVPMVEAMVWLVLADHLLRQRALTGRCGPLAFDQNGTNQAEP
jgi:chorismate synthase